MCRAHVKETCAREERRPPHAQVGEQERIWRTVTAPSASWQCVRARREERTSQPASSVAPAGTARCRASGGGHRARRMLRQALRIRCGQKTCPAATDGQQPRAPVVVDAIARQGALVAAHEGYRTDLALLHRVYQGDLSPHSPRPAIQRRASTAPPVTRSPGHTCHRPHRPTPHCTPPPPASAYARMLRFASAAAHSRARGAPGARGITTAGVWGAATPSSPTPPQACLRRTSSRSCPSCTGDRAHATHSRDGVSDE